MNQSYEIVETYVGVPTIFTLYVDDALGFARVFLFLHNETKTIPASYTHKEIINNITYSVFEVIYTFSEKCTNGTANFYFTANDKRYDCEQMHFIVTT